MAPIVAKGLSWLVDRAPGWILSLCGLTHRSSAAGSRGYLPGGHRVFAGPLIVCKLGVRPSWRSGGIGHIAPLERRIGSRSKTRAPRP